MRLTALHRKALPVIGVLVAVQSLCLYSAVARLPVALALLAFNTYPLWTALWARVFYAHRPEPQLLRAMPVMLIGLALALDVFGAAAHLSAAAHGGEIGVGVGTQGGFHLPQALLGWLGLVGLTVLYGTAFRLLFTVLPRLGVVGNSAIMNVEPIFALVLAWAWLGHLIAQVQIAGSLPVVATAIWLGLRRRA